MQASSCSSSARRRLRERGAAVGRICAAVAAGGLAVDVGDQHGRPFCRHPQRGGAPDPGAAARDHGDLAVELPFSSRRPQPCLRLRAQSSRAICWPSVRYPAMAPERLFVASADGHVGIPTASTVDVPRSGVPGAVRRLPRGAQAALVGGGAHVGARPGRVGLVARQRAVRERAASRASPTPSPAVKEIDEDGVAVEVLFADDQNENTAPWLGGGLVQVGLQKEYSSELRMAGARAYNRWLAEFCCVRTRPLRRRDRDPHPRGRRRRRRRGTARPLRRAPPQRAAPARLRAAGAPPQERAVLGRVLRARPHRRGPPRGRLTALGRRRRVGFRDRDHGDLLLRAPSAVVHGVRRCPRTPSRLARGVHRVGRRLGAGHAHADGRHRQGSPLALREREAAGPPPE